MATHEKNFPEDMVPLGDGEFQFACHPGVSCFTVCCRNVDMILYPYDVIRLKNCIGMDSEDFVRKHTTLVKGENPFFPTLKLRLTGGDVPQCPFLQHQGCSVYPDRPSACRTYPLERAVDRSGASASAQDYYFLTDHPYCHGHNEKKIHRVATWIRDQRLTDYNAMNSLWAEIDTVFATNPWKGEGVAGEKQQLAFMVCYNIDQFRRFCHSHKLLKSFRLDKDFRRRIEKEDSELLKFGFEWLKLVLTGKGSLISR